MKKILPLLLFISTSSFCQSALEKNTQALVNYTQASVMEKVYLHIDKPTYIAGDTIWYKAYLVDAIFHQVDSASGALYIDLIKKDGREVIVHDAVRVSGGLASSEMPLDEDLPQGAYVLRAYTNWMRNFPDQFFFQKTIHIYKADETSVKNFDETDSRKLELKHVSFFPEGGNLVKGLPGRVAFKAMNHLGKGTDITGHIVSELGDTITHIKSQHLGMGYFTITPQAGRSYTLLVQGSDMKFPVPQALDHGYSLMVDNINKTAIKVYIRHNFPQPDRAILIAHQRGFGVYAAQMGSDNNSGSLVISRASIPMDGIVHLTLFDSEGNPHCERIIYNSKNEPIVASITPDKKIYKPREKVTLDISVTDSQGAPVQGNFSLAVTDAMQVHKLVNAENIESYLLLSSDIQSAITGAIEEPARYFDASNRMATIDLDLLLMTQGWRRFTWTDILPGKTPSFQHSFEQGITVSGQILQPNGKAARKAVGMTLLYRGNVIQQTTDAEGRFNVPGLNIIDSTKLLVQGRKESGGRYLDITIDPPSIPDVTHLPDASTTIDNISLDLWLEQWQQYEQFQKTLQSGRIKTLEAIEIVGTRVESDSRRALYGSVGVRTINVDDRTCGGATHVLQLLQSRLAGVNVTGFGQNVAVTLRSGTPTFLLDGSIVDLETISSVSPCDVEAIDVISRPTLAVSGSPGGLISILTKRGNSNYDWSADEARGIKVSKVFGFNAPREFYSPDYEDEESDQQIMDVRSTLFWQPDIAIGKDGKASVSFYNTDRTTEVHVELEGLSGAGKPVANVVRYTVE